VKFGIILYSTMPRVEAKHTKVMSYASLRQTTITTYYCYNIHTECNEYSTLWSTSKIKTYNGRISHLGTITGDLLARGGNGCSAADRATRPIAVVAMTTAVGDRTSTSQLMLEATVLAAERAMALEAIVRVQR
jgi:hypothetical protein